MLNVFNVRMGSATNSSSTHSIVISPNMYTTSFKDVYADQYGWSLFKLSTEKEKRRYFTLQLISWYRSKHSLSHEEAKILAECVFKPTDLGDGYVDHQSCLKFATPHLTYKQPQIKLWDWIDTHVISDNRIDVIGGSANDVAPPEIEHLTVFEGPWNRDRDLDYKYKMDPQGFLTVYTKGDKHHNSLKFRVGPCGFTEPMFTYYPDLVDVKITDYCEKGCKHCYQDSTASGVHADISDIRKSVSAFLDLGIFEAAIGGGEPTSHPEFPRVLELFHNYNITPNFSTGTLEWLSNNNIISAVKKYCKGVAYSTTSIIEAKKWLRLYKANFSDTGIECTIHYVLGTKPISSLDRFIKSINAYTKERYIQCNIVLLGWKSTGRGSKGPAHDASNWWSIIDKNFLTKDSARYSFLTISIDSWLVDDVACRLKGIDPVLYGKDDGAFSFYVDTVNMTASPHSASDIKIEFNPYESFKAWRKVLDCQFKTDSDVWELL